ncbi:hypothetical protein E2C01_056392 [Portunus trituberculatus]|uniref:Uncharacterized protein n=1 Tax=Portunus trituberculatus TaxID=210409 RepID=A0A5B7GZH1_PORTR|nr:hypothetical protein [Portunus trituberculatus]
MYVPISQPFPFGGNVGGIQKDTARRGVLIISPATLPKENARIALFFFFLFFFRFDGNIYTIAST